MRSILEVIEEQLVANRLPLAGVTLAALPFPNTPAVVSLHWHAFVETTGPTESPLYQSVPSSALQLNIRWDQFANLETDVLEASWELGAWDLCRIEAPACGGPDGPVQRYAECLASFGLSPAEINGDRVFVADVPDGEELVEAATRVGYVRWQFRPTWCGLWKELADDVTLQAGGYRNPRCPLAARPYEPGNAGTVVFQLGKPNH
jgi:hypothetical protein